MKSTNTNNTDNILNKINKKNKKDKKEQTTFEKIKSTIITFVVALVVVLEFVFEFMRFVLALFLYNAPLDSKWYLTVCFQNIKICFSALWRYWDTRGYLRFS